MASNSALQRVWSGATNKPISSCHIKASPLILTLLAALMLAPQAVLRVAEGIKISADSFTLRFTAEGRPESCVRKADGTEFLPKGRPGEGFFLQVFTAGRGWRYKHADECRDAGPSRYLGYDSPFVPWFVKFGEVQMPIATMGK